MKLHFISTSGLLARLGEAYRRHLTCPDTRRISSNKGTWERIGHGLWRELD